MSDFSALLTYERSYYDNGHMCLLGVNQTKNQLLLLMSSFASADSKLIVRNKIKVKETEILWKKNIEGAGEVILCQNGDTILIFHCRDDLKEGLVVWCVENAQTRTMNMGEMALHDLTACLYCQHGIIEILGSDGQYGFLNMISEEMITIQLSHTFMRNEATVFWGKGGLLCFVQTTDRFVKSWCIDLDFVINTENKTTMNTVEAQKLDVVLARWCTEIPRSLMTLIQAYSPRAMYYLLMTCDESMTIVNEKSRICRQRSMTSVRKA